MSEKKVLILYAHPSPHRSEVNQPRFNSACEVEGVTAVDLYYEYPTFNIDIEKEQRRLVEHDVIIFQFPLFWYSTPAILKEWQDLVLEYGFAYGRDGTALQGKTFFCAVSAGGNEEAYQTDGFNSFTVRELLSPIEQTARLTGMNYLPPFILFGSRTAAEENRIGDHIADWKRLLQALVQDQIDPTAAADAATLELDQLVTGAAS